MYDCKGISIHYTQTGQNPHKWYDVPRLRLGAVDDLEYVIDQYRLNGEGLLEMIRLKSEERPTYIIDNHNHALYCWVEALREIKPQNRVVVLRFDSHADHSKFGADPVPDLSNISLSQVHDYVLKLGIANFTYPAINSGVMDELVVVDPTLSDQERYFPENQEYIDYTKVGIHSNKVKELMAQARDGEITLILDIDVDYFLPHFGNDKPFHYSRLPFVSGGYAKDRFTRQSILQNDTSIITNLLYFSQIRTFATSPGFIDQDFAIEYIQSLFSNKKLNLDRIK